MHILYAPNDAEAPEWLAALSAALPDATLSVWDPAGPPVGADIAIVWNPPAEVFKRETGLRAVFTRGAGVNSVLAIPGLPADLPIIRLEDAGMGVQMAEYAIHALVAASRQFDMLAQRQAEGVWAEQEVIPTLRRDWPVGVLGLGQLGTHVAQAIASLGYPVAGWSRSPRAIEGVQGFHGTDALSAFLARTRVLVNLLPLTPETDGILNRHTLSQLLPGGHLINLARGAHLVEEDLIPLLDAGRLAGATLDVFRTEPLPAGHPFWTHPKVRVTPHIAAITLREEAISQIVTKLQAMARGEAVSGVVDRSRGY